MKLHTITAGELKGLLKNIPDDVEMCVGYGSNYYPLRFLERRGDRLGLHTDIYGVTDGFYQDLHNRQIVFDFLTDKKQDYEKE